ncbi:MAG: lytic transglycosylase domain-containing protein [Rhizobacter sp.]|nr:lytic transglycosylase domain-containing protein [Rhizobacter sp.]
MLPTFAGSFTFSATRLLLPCCFALALHTGSLASPRAGIYLIEDDSGALHLTDDAQGRNASLVLETDKAATDQRPGQHPAQRHAPAPRDARLAEIVRTAAQAHRLAPELLHAVIAAESGYAVRAVSPRGAQGLMQLMPATARGYGVTDPFDPGQNIHAGARHLRSLLDQFNQNISLALAAYNAGAASVLRHHNRIPPFAETAAYVPRVLRHLAQQQPAAGHPSAPSP